MIHTTSTYRPPPRSGSDCRMSSRALAAASAGVVAVELVVFVVRVAGAFGRLGRHRAERVADARSLDPSLIGSRAVGVRDRAHVGPPAAAGELRRRRAEADVGPSSVVTGRRARLAHAIERLCQSLGRVLLVERRLWGKGTGGGRGGGSEIWVGGGARFRGKTIGGFDAPCRHPPGRRGRRSPRPRRRRPYTGRRAAARVATPSRRGATLRFSQRRVPGEKLRCHRRACGTEIFSDRCSSPHPMGLAHRGRLDPRRVPRRRPHRYPRFASIHTGINEFMF